LLLWERHLGRRLGSSLPRLVDKARAGQGWRHEIKYDVYRMPWARDWS
jgi:hypothetical protein